MIYYAVILHCHNEIDIQKIVWLQWSMFLKRSLKSTKIDFEFQGKSFRLLAHRSKDTSIEWYSWITLRYFFSFFWPLAFNINNSGSCVEDLGKFSPCVFWLWSQITKNCSNYSVPFVGHKLMCHCHRAMDRWPHSTNAFTEYYVRIPIREVYKTNIWYYTYSNFQKPTSYFIEKIHIGSHYSYAK